ncbi:ATP-binding cassette domain-containing protein [Pontibacillus yanchengensis]|uniref:ATP-binding cassette domain-containing protein n=2 Tax=Pontibacillus yanchengensis TaxID=462910 RepID=A0ACC7VKB0_9BACI|nr:metal ABC transporter ATP-binding protein [Pontibacillus yanchengensis]MYL33696.1 ATP-binding cassette domain-containing protein [Pontibacillus yanchengensis]MYL55406.1 ATP-binding cassette domain-containing protein [Pontibacillus yanchengensis]
MSTKSILEIDDLSYAYEDKQVLEDIDFSIHPGSFVGLVGPNGSGKTTLIKLILGLLPHKRGSIRLFDTPIEKFKDWNRIGFVSQKANSFNTGFPATVYEVVSMGLTSKVGYFRFFQKQHVQKIKHAVDIVGMTEYLHKNVGDLSGGQQQRVFIARALVSEPDFLILDEPTVGVDAENVQRFYEMLADLNKNKGITLLLVTHDTGTMTSYATNIACLNKRIHFHGDPHSFEHMSDQDLSEMYGHNVHLVKHEH